MVFENSTLHFLEIEITRFLFNTAQSVYNTAHLITFFFLYKNKFYKNIEAQNRQRTMEI